MRHMLCVAHLPCSTLITLPGKIPAFVSLSCTGTRGGEISDGGGRGTPGCRRKWQGAFRPRRMEMLLDSEGFWRCDKLRIRAVMLLFTLQLEALEITPTSPLVPYINWLYPRTQAEF